MKGLSEDCWNTELKGGVFGFHCVGMVKKILESYPKASPRAPATMPKIHTISLNNISPQSPCYKPQIERALFRIILRDISGRKWSEYVSWSLRDGGGGGSWITWCFQENLLPKVEMLYFLFFFRIKYLYFIICPNIDVYP